MVSFAKPIDAVVVQVIDGDSIQVQQNNKRYILVRLFGIDAPELNQPYGLKSKRYLQKKVLNKPVKIKLLSRDSYGRRLAILFDSDGRNVNLDLIRNGFAWVYKQYYSDPKWLAIQEQASHERVGLWSQKKPIPPWIYRRKSYLE